MSFYTSAVPYGNKIRVREVVNGVPVKREFEWAPTVYVRDQKETEYKTLFGDSVKSIKLNNLGELKDFLTRYSDVDGFEIYGQMDPSLAFLSEYPQEENVDFSQILVRVLDIETEVPESGFPVPIKAEARVTLITCEDLGRHKEIVTFGLKPYDGRDTRYVECADEETLFRQFLAWWSTKHPDIITGWNVNGFDIPYLAVRIGKVLGDVSQLSPWGQVKVKPSRIAEDELDVDIVGCSVLDYMDLMKKYTYGNRPSWSLGAVASEELGTTKLDHSEFKNFNEFMEKDWNKFVRYNIIDVRLVSQLDEKMKLIDLALTVAYVARINFSDVFSPVRTWDAILHNALLKKRVVIPQRKSAGGSKDQIEGAYVKSPIPGMYKFVTSIDATSLYPSIMQTLNISPETFVGMTDSSVASCLSGNWPLSKSGMNVAVGANGAMFSKDKRGIIPELIDGFMSMRKKAKNEMLSLEALYEKTNDSDLLPKISALNNLQMAAKILMNSLYGAMGNQGFRFFNSDVAESITTTGQLFLRYVDNNLSKKMSDTFKIPMKDYVVYTDTDSLYISLEEVVKKYLSNEPIDKIIKAMEKTTKEKIQVMVNDLCKVVAEKMTVYENKISFKLEIAADKAIFCAKKKYAARVYSSEGVTYSKPKIKVKGLEMVRSSTPGYVRGKLEDAFELIFSSDEKDVQKFISNIKSEFMKLAPEDIARPTGVSNLVEYSSKIDKSVKDRLLFKDGSSVPIHVRASILYNRMLKDKQLQGVYHDIKEGDKIKYVYLKTPNPTMDKVIAWPVDDELPKEFNLHKYVDYETQFDKTFLSAIQIILTAIGWSAVEISTLDDFFS